MADGVVMAPSAKVGTVVAAALLLAAGCGGSIDAGLPPADPPPGDPPPGDPPPGAPSSPCPDGWQAATVAGWEVVASVCLSSDRTTVTVHNIAPAAFYVVAASPVTTVAAPYVDQLTPQGAVDASVIALQSSPGRVLVPPGATASAQAGIGESVPAIEIEATAESIASTYLAAQIVALQSRVVGAQAPPGLGLAQKAAACVDEASRAVSTQQGYAGTDLQRLLLLSIDASGAYGACKSWVAATGRTADDVATEVRVLPRPSEFRSTLLDDLAGWVRRILVFNPHG